MSQLLFIEASPRKIRSTSTEVAHSFLDEYQKHHKLDTVEHIDLWTTFLPAFDHDTIEAKYAIMQQQSHTEAQRKAWKNVEDLIKQFKTANAYLFSLPMWNFSVPYKLKHYFDLIVQPTYTFNFSPEKGYEGLVVNKPVILIYSRSGAYKPGSGAEHLDLQKLYMETILKFIGFTTFHTIIVEPTMPKEKREEALQVAKQEATQLAAQISL